MTLDHRVYAEDRKDYYAGAVAANRKRPKVKRVAVSATRAKVMTEEQFQTVLDEVRGSEHVKRNVALVMLSFYCGLRVQEIAGLRWYRNALDANGEIGKVIHVTEDIGKRSVEREIAINTQLRRALKDLRNERPHDVCVIYPLQFHRGISKDRKGCPPNTLAQYLRRLYRKCGFVGCTSHSGRRTFITNLARKCNTVNASLRDVQIMAGHRSLRTTEAYIEPSENQHKLVNMVF